MVTKKASKGKDTGKARRKLAVKKETLKDLTVKGAGAKGGLINIGGIGGAGGGLMAKRTWDRYCFSKVDTCLCKTQLDCI
jgi:hypothetical protein